VELLTAGVDVAEVHPNLGVQRETPGRLHLPAGVTAEVVSPAELRVFGGGEVVLVRVLGGPRLTQVARFGHADRALVVGPAAVIAAVIRGRIWNREKLLCEHNFRIS